MYFQLVETECFQHGVNLMSTCTALPCPGAASWPAESNEGAQPAVVVQVDILLDPVLKALVFQVLESTTVSSRWFQISTLHPLHPVHQESLVDR